MLDPFLEKLIDPVVAELRERIRAQGNQLDVHILFQYMYMLTKTRGYKTIGKEIVSKIFFIEHEQGYLPFFLIPSFHFVLQSSSCHTMSPTWSPCSSSFATWIVHLALGRRDTFALYGCR